MHHSRESVEEFTALTVWNRGSSAPLTRKQLKQVGTRRKYNLEGFSLGIHLCQLVPMSQTEPHVLKQHNPLGTRHSNS